ncbi:MAG TPA: DNA polymerase Y family protein [Thermohalobaculum sp.]|nr:DNA polymerase Y family protein [Thermohalobaculum sp.]
MPRRIAAAALPHLAAEALLRREGQQGFPRPFAVTGQARGAQRLVSVNPAAAALGLGPGLGLADARALCPGLATRPEEPERLAAFRRALARWAGRFSPLVAMEEQTLILDATGCAHLFGGEAAMLAGLTAGLAAYGLTAHAAMADTRGAAWALAHHGPAATPLIAPKGHTRDAIDALPVAALRLAPEAAEGLAALGLATIGDAARVPRGALARRFGLATLKRLDQALGAEPEPVAPDRAAPPFAVRLTLPEPIGLTDDLMAGLDRLLERLCQALEARQQGARALRLTMRRVDGADAHAQIALARPGRDPVRLSALFRPAVEKTEAGFGIDALRLEATATEPLKPAQISRRSEPEKLADLLSRLGNRVGFDCLTRFLPAESHIPERAFTLAAAAWSQAEPFPHAGPPRPLTLFPPEPLEVADTPAASLPARFRWRGRWLTLTSAEGPERLAPEWWWDDPAWASGTRDYWRAATAEGPRLWLFHTPQAACPGWWAQGAFA